MSFFQTKNNTLNILVMYLSINNKKTILSTIQTFLIDKKIKKLF
jgi:hypothetical protein